MAVTLTRARNGQAANTIYASGYTAAWANDEALLLAEGSASTILDSATDYNAYRQYTQGIGLAGNGLPSALAGVGVGTQYITPANTQKIRSAMARSDRNAIVVCVGPSTTAGETDAGGATQQFNSWPMQLARVLQAQGVPAGANSSFGDHGFTSNYVARDNRNALSGSATVINGVTTVGGNAIQMASAGSYVFTPQANVTKYDIWWRDGGTGRTFSWAIDGGAATNISSIGTNIPQKTTVSAGAAGLHTLTLAWVLGNVNIIGVVGYDDTAGRREISFYNWGISGARSDQLLSDIESAAGRIKVWDAVAPDLTILDDWPINDWRQGDPYTVANFGSNLQTGITQAKKSGDVVVTTPLWDSVLSGNSPNQDAYAAEVVRVAMLNNVPIIDVRGGLVSFAAANALGWYSGTVHPNPLGYAVKAAAISEFFRRLKAL